MVHFGCFLRLLANPHQTGRPTKQTSFTFHPGTYQYVRMSLCLTNVPATFKRAFHLISYWFIWETCLIYLGDVIIYSNSMEAHMTHLEEILTYLEETLIALKVSKCSFISDQVEYLDHIIRPEPSYVSKVNTKSLKSDKMPTNKTDLRSFLGVWNFYWRVVPQFNDIVAPLNKLL